MALFDNIGQRLAGLFLSPHVAKKQTEIKTLAAPKTPSEKDNTQTTIAQLNRRTMARGRQDLTIWKRAVEAAEYSAQPRLLQLSEVYRNVEIDEHLTACVEQRKGAVTSARFAILKDNEPHPDMTALAEATWLHDFINIALGSIFTGYGVCELVGRPYSKGGICDAVQIPMAHINPGNRNIIFDANDDTGISIADPAYNLIELQKPFDFGLFMKATPAVIGSRNCFSAWADFAEVFGAPLRIGKTDSQQPGYIDAMEQFLANMGRMPYALISKEDDIQLSADSRSDAFNVFERLIERHEKRISKLILQQTGTTDEKAFVGSAEVHERVADKIARQDQRFIATLINTRLFPVLIKLGYPLQGCKFAFINEERITELDLKQDQFLLQNFEFENLEYFTKKYKVPILSVKGLQQPPAAAKKP